MSNFAYYMGFVFFGVGIFAFTVYKKGKFTDLLLFFLAVSVLSWVGEFFVLFLFNAYAYKLGLFTDPFAENALGHLITNTFLWGATSVLVGAFSLRYRWIFLISSSYMLIEISFLKLGLYEHHWWKTYMTGIAAFIFLIVAKTWYSKMNETRYMFLRYITFYFVSFFFIHVSTVTLLLLGKQSYGVGWYEDLYRNSSVFVFIYDIGISVVIIYFVLLQKKWYWSLVPILICFLADSILVKINILIFHCGWNLFYLTLTRTISLVIFILFVKYILKQRPQGQTFLIS